MTYNEAYNKIIDAYFKDEIKPYDQDFCFCGTLCNGNGRWWWWSRSFDTETTDFNYSKTELLKMEKALLVPLAKLVNRGDIFLSDEKSRLKCQSHSGYEDTLFAGMSAALDVLKQIHIERGEVIDETPVFTKRQLV